PDGPSDRADDGERLVEADHEAAVCDAGLNVNYAEARRGCGGANFPPEATGVFLGRKVGEFRWAGALVEPRRWRTRSRRGARRWPSSARWSRSTIPKAWSCRS